MPTGKCLHPSIRKLLFKMDRGHSRKPQPIQMKVMEPSPNRYFYKTQPQLKLREHCGR